MSNNSKDDTRQLLVNGVADAVGFVGGALLGFWLGQLLGLDIFAPGYGTGPGGHCPGGTGRRPGPARCAALADQSAQQALQGLTKRKDPWLL